MNISPPTEKFHYRQPPNGHEITGLDLGIDKHTQKLCETYNKSSGATRSVLYVLLLLCVISLIAVFNNNWAFNWTNERVQQDKQKLIGLERTKKLKGTDITKADNEIAETKKEEEALIQADVDNNYTIRFSVLGIAIDTLDLASISGLSLLILLVVLRFTLIREKNNLKLALNSINERYPDDADFYKFKSLIGTQYRKPVFDNDEQWCKVIADINFVRRRYHYNFLSMNDIFNMPFLDIVANTLQGKVIGRIINKYLFYFFLLIYSYIILNAFCSIHQAQNLNAMHTRVILGLSVIFYILIFNACRRCVEQRKIIYKSLKKFWMNGYVYSHKEYEPGDMSPLLSIIVKIIIPAALICVLYVFSLVVR